MKKIIAALLFALSLPALAQSWPSRPVKLILPLGPGSGADIAARLFSERLSARWGQPVVVENRPGGDGVIAINAVIQAKDDHTLLWGPTSSFVGHPYTLAKIPYDPNELVPVARITSTVVTLAVPASSGFNSLKDVVEFARRDPGKLNWTTIVAVTDIVLDAFFNKAGIKAVRVPYKNPTGAVTDLIEGRLHLYSSAYAIVRPQLPAGKIKLLAVQNSNRVPGLDLPTVKELGFPDLTFDGLTGVIAARSSNLPEAARERIAADIKAIAAEPAVAERLAATAQINVPGNAAEFAASIDEQVKAMEAVARFSGLKASR
ncbi:MAG: Bug family tripartite tricarboxylate transporter substrate binding protein [Betaproteobacteria bacterium]